MQRRTIQYNLNSELIQLFNKRPDHERPADEPILSDI